MRRDKAHALARFLIDDPLAFVPENPEHCGLGRRLLEKDAYKINQSLRLGPLTIETCLEKLVVGKKIRRCGWLAGFRK
jgi:hypothetical protein